MKKALITGITGQDGSYLAELLLENRVASRMHAKDATLFDFSDVALQSAQDYMGWTDLASNPPTAIEQIQVFAQEALAEGIDYVGLLGEGGSSQAPMTITKLSAAQHRDVRFSWTTAGRSLS